MREPMVYVVDDDPDMRDSLLWLLRTVGLRVEVHASAAAFLEVFEDQGPACLVSDVRMPGMSGLDLYERLVARGEAIPVIFVTAYADVPMAVRALKSGAVEFMEKPFNCQALLDRVQLALEHDTARRRRVAARAALARRFSRLTDKEREVLNFVKEGQPNKAISSALGITARAVEMRRASLMNKLGARSLAELLRMSLELDDDDVPNAAR